MMLKKLVNVSRAPKNLSPLCAVYSRNGDLYKHRGLALILIKDNAMDNTNIAIVGEKEELAGVVTLTYTGNTFV